MRTFTDNAGRIWTVAITVDSVKRVRALLQFDLLDVVGEAGSLASLSADPILLANVLYAVCKPEADTRGVTDEDFGRSLAGDSIDAATAALLEDLCDFFPKSKRDPLRKLLEKTVALQERRSAVLTQALDNPIVERRIEADFQKAMADLLAESGDSSISVPASPE